MAVLSRPLVLASGLTAAVAAAAAALGVVLFFKHWLGRRSFCRGSHGGEVRQPIAAILANPEDIKYTTHHRRHLQPKVMGSGLRLRVWLAMTRFGRSVLVPLVRMRVDALEGVYLPEKPTLYPTPPTATPTEDHAHSNSELLQALVDKEVRSKVKKEGGADHFYFPTVADYIQAYRSKQTTPTQVAEAVLAAIAHSDQATPPLRAIIDSCRPVVLAMAEASTLRWKEGKTLSIIDGVPVAVKSELRVEPYELLSGSMFISHLVHGLPESVIAQKLRDAGAVLVGVTNMQEFGMGTIGSNPNPRHLTPRNPYDPRRYTGGSSSGSAASVAAGFCPIAIGTDGGGSVRIPAATCGVVGLKPTNRTLDTTGVLPITHSVSVTGPLTSSVLDAAIAMAIVSRETDSEKVPLSLSGLGATRLDGLKVGVYSEFFGDAEREVVDVCKSALGQLQSLGAQLVEVKIPELESIRIAHMVTIVSEFYASLAKEIDDHHAEMNLETLSVFSYADSMSAMEYINAQKQRTRAVEILRHIFQQQGVDVIVTPATVCPAPAIEPGAEVCGCLDMYSSMCLMQYMPLANLTGIPGLVLPVGYTEDSGLPIGLQLMAAWHQENLLLKVGWALEQTGAFPCKKPQIFYDILSGSQ